ncbi:tyrosine-type recombinase/integrase [Burkholderia stagnalis]|uniref:tyrosine-type recombinase/integrase n=1 Tax=Burkholderia stagnalis TaxID=1503054 RepID=UPI0032656ABD
MRQDHQQQGRLYARIGRRAACEASGAAAASVLPRRIENDHCRGCACASRASAQPIDFWFWTGLRTSEIFGLQWLNVDLPSGTILVAEAPVGGEQQDRTKTAVARTVRLSSRALSA